MRKTKMALNNTYTPEYIAKRLKIHYIQRVEVWSADGVSNQEVSIPYKACDQSDFGFDKKDVIFFNEWKGYFLICPDFTNKPGGKSDFELLEN